MIEFFILCCGGLFLLVALIYIPVFIIRRGLSLIWSCFGNLITVLIAAILLVIYLVTTNVDICQTWLIGEPLCTLWNNIGLNL